MRPTIYPASTAVMLTLLLQDAHVYGAFNVAVGIGASGESSCSRFSVPTAVHVCMLFAPLSVGPVLSGEVVPTTHLPRRSHLTVISADIPTFQQRVDDPQSSRSGDHTRCERSRCVVYRRKTAREAVKRIQTGLEMNEMASKGKWDVRPASRASSDESRASAGCIFKLMASELCGRQCFVDNVFERFDSRVIYVGIHV